MSLKNLQNQHHDGNVGNNVTELKAYAAPLVHDTVFGLCQKILSAHNKGKGLTVLVLGAGSGYFDKRLLDEGIKNIDAIEYIPEHYKVKGTRLFSYDLNNTWANKLLTQNNNRKYDLIIAIEVIEHLENSFQLLREIKSVLGYNGQIIITSPNVESLFSRIRYMLTGSLEYFGQSELNGTGHINPIFNHILRLNLELNKIKLLHIYNNRNIWKSRTEDAKSIKKIILIIISILAFFISIIVSRRNIFKNKNEGDRKSVV